MRTLDVGDETARQLKNGHPWVVADRFTARWPKNLKAGEIVLLRAPGGDGLGSALVDPGARVVARLLDADSNIIDRDWIEQRLKRAVAMRKELVDQEKTDCLRLVNGEGDGLPGLTLDRYGDWLVLQLYTDAWQPHLELLDAAIGRVFRPSGLYLKHRPQQTRELAKDKHSDLVRLVSGRPAPDVLTVHENGLDFLVRLNEGLHTGLFLDLRDQRARFRQLARDRRVLNLFCFTGAFSVAALAGGARQVVSVDAARGYLDWCRDNIAASGLPGERSELVRGDCFKVLRRLKEEGRTFDLVFVDPPSFSTVGKKRFTTRQGTAELFAELLPLVEPGGLVMACSNHQKIDWPDYFRELRRAAVRAGRGLQVLHTSGQGADFPYTVAFGEGRYLKCVILRT
ncbi:MAG: class I SAM-dependent rRNA methyltransferase [Geothermobacteraceae bacterium]